MKPVAATKALPVLVWLALCTALAAIILTHAWVIAVDDIFINLWVGRSLPAYGWFVNYNFDFQEMSSSIIAVLAASAAYIATPDYPFLTTRLLCFVASALALAIWLRSNRLFFLNDGVTLTAAALFASICSPTFYYWSAAVLEQPFYALFIAAYVCSLAALIHAPHKTAAVWLSVSLSMLMLVRPETFWLLPFHACLTFILPIPVHARRASIHALACAAAVLFALLAIRWFGYGYLLPNPAYAKSSIMLTPMWTMGRGLTYLYNFYNDYGIINIFRAAAVVASLCLWLHFMYARLLRRTIHTPLPVLILCAVILAFHLSIILMGGDWMPYARLMMPVLPLIDIFMLCMLARLPLVAASSRARSAVACAIILLALTQVGLPNVPHETQMTDTPTSTYQPAGDSLKALNDSIQAEHIKLRGLYEWEFLTTEFPAWAERLGHVNILLTRAGSFPSQLRTLYPELDSRVTFIDSFGLVDRRIGQLPVKKNRYGLAAGYYPLRLLTNTDAPLPLLVQSMQPNMLYVDHGIPSEEKAGIIAAGFELVWDKPNALFFVKTQKTP